MVSTGLGLHRGWIGVRIRVSFGIMGKVSKYSPENGLSRMFAQRDMYLYLAILLHCWRLVMPDDLEMYRTTKFDKDILVDHRHCLNYIKRPSAGNEDVTFTIHIPCK